MDILTDIPKGCKIEKIGEPYKVSSVTMQNVKYSASNKTEFLRLKKALERCKNIFVFMQKSGEFDSMITAQFVIEDPNHVTT